MGFKRHTLWGAALGALAIVAGQPHGAFAEGPNKGRLSIELNDDITSAYMFRGIMNENEGLIWQPSAALKANLYSDDDGFLKSVDVGFGVWASYHSKETLHSGKGPDPLYEVDYYPSISATLSNGLSTGLTYYFYTGPNGSFDTVQELSWLIEYDDSALFEDMGFSLQPAVEFAFEMDNTSFGNGKGIFTGISLAPTTEVLKDSSYPITFTVPLKLGLSADEYYYNPSAGYDNDTFGFFLFGLGASVPLAFIPEDFGAWSVGARADVYVLGDQLHSYAENNFDHTSKVYPVGTFSLSLAY